MPGHPPAVVRYADGRTVLLDEQCDPPLGYVSTVHRHRAELAPGATLVLYTDGLVERRTESLNTGFERLLSVCSAGPSDADALCDHLALEMFRDAPVDDDVAIFVATLE